MLFTNHGFGDMVIIKITNLNNAHEITIGNQTNINLPKLREVVIKMNQISLLEPYIHISGDAPVESLINVLIILREAGVKKVDLYCEGKENKIMIPLEINRNQIESCVGPVSVKVNPKNDNIIEPVPILRKLEMPPIP
jgi:hypothetical protein